MGKLETKNVEISLKNNYSNCRLKNNISIFQLIFITLSFLNINEGESPRKQRFK